MCWIRLFFTALLGLSTATLHAAASAPVRVLFVGNSYTYYNNLPELVSQLSGGAIEARMVTRGESNLQQTWDRGEALAAIREARWDWVVIQEQSLLGGMRVDGVEHVNEPDFFWDNVRLYDAEIRKAKARTMLYLTWARHAAPEQQAYLNHAYATIAQELGLTVAPVGEAWQRVRDAHPSLALHAADGSHPSAMGSYLAACVLVKSILGSRAPARFPARIMGHPIGSNELPDPNRVTELVNLPPDRAAILQDIAARAELAPSATKPPAPPQRASLPTPKRGFNTTDLTGVWRGTLRYYATPMNAELRVAIRDGQRCSAHWAAWTSNGDRKIEAPVTSCRFTEVGITFLLPDYRGAGPAETFWAHYTGDTLTGWADYRGLRKSSRLMGSFELRRVKP